jgi:hypothetical protein
VINEGHVEDLEKIAANSGFDRMVEVFMLDMLQVPPEEVAQIRGTAYWDTWIADAANSLNDLRALVNYTLDFEHFRSLTLPVLLQIGTESPREIYITDAIAEVLPNAHIAEPRGQAHEGMTTAPEMYAEQLTAFLLD